MLRVGALALLAVEAIVFPLTPAHGEDVPPTQAPVADEVSRSAVPSWAKVSAAQLAEAKRLTRPVAFENSIGMRFVLIPAGKFTMGSLVSEKGRSPDETQHEVALTEAFYLSIHETTNAQYRRFRSEHDSGQFDGESLNGDTQPVVSVSHDDATDFLTWLDKHDRSHVYALPTEARWEYACRAGTTTRYSFGDRDDDLVRFANTSIKNDASEPVRKDLDDGHSVSAAVGSYAPNPWGLFDMHGNVWEWCADWSDDYPSGAVTDPTGPFYGKVRVFRGGSWGGVPRVSAADRRSTLPSYRHLSGGFRVVASLAPR